MSEKLKNFFTKKNIIIISVIALVLIIGVIISVAFICGSNNKNQTSDSVTNGTETVDFEKTEDTKNNDSSVSDDKNNPSTDSADNQNGSNNNSDNNTKDTKEDDYTENFSVNTDDYPVDVVFVEKTEDKNAWPKDEIPSDVPECKYISMDACTKQEDDTSKAWFMSWVSNISDYEAWMTKITSSFASSQTMLGRYANGSVVLDITTEEAENGKIWVSCDIFKSIPIDYKAMPLNDCFPEFNNGDATLEYFVDYEDEGKFICQFTCSSDWKTLLFDYKTDLKKSGYTVEELKAYKNIGGKTYTVIFGDEKGIFNEKIIFVY